MDDTYIQALLSKGQSVLLYFTATWCEPCKTYGPKIESVAKRYPDIRFYKVSVEDNPKLASSYEVMSLPTTIYFRPNHTPKVIIGTAPEDKIIHSLGL